METLWSRPLGCILLLSIAILAAYQRLQADRRRLAVLDAWIALIGSMRWEIDSCLTPIDRFFTQADKRILHTLGKSDAKAPSELLAFSLPHLTPESKDAITRFSERLGDCYRTEQLRRCDECLSRLVREREREAGELPARRRLGTALPLSLALGIVILLW